MAQRPILVSLLILLALTGAAGAQSAASSAPGAGSAGGKSGGTRAAIPATASPTESRIHILTASLGKAALNQACDATQAVAEKCEGLSRCRITAANTLCQDPTFPKNMLIATLEVQYRCSPQDQPRTALADRPLGVTIVCRRKAPLP